jgi:hypothetical protein
MSKTRLASKPCGHSRPLANEGSALDIPFPHRELLLLTFNYPITNHSITNFAERPRCRHLNENKILVLARISASILQTFQDDLGSLRNRLL